MFILQCQAYLSLLKKAQRGVVLIDFMVAFLYNVPAYTVTVSLTIWSTRIKYQKNTHYYAHG